ncbi:MAG: hypothetical protein HGN29_02860 [Asgard group archaeon]|nr:hypothetical protein [Asgard group archaeon]
MYIYIKYIAAIALVCGGFITVYWGRRRQNPFYLSWSLFLISYGIFSIVDTLESMYETILLYRILLIFQSFAWISLFAASLEQSMITTPRASKIVAISLGVFVLYFIIIPLNPIVNEFKTLTISIYNKIYTDIYGFIFAFFILISAFLLINVFKRYLKLASISKKKRLKVKRDVTLVFILMLIGLAFLVLIRRRLDVNNLEYFELVDVIYSFVVVLTVALYQSQSMSHGIETILVVDKEGNPLLGYSPIRSRRISFEEKIIAAAGYLAGLFNFIHNYVATTSDEQFKEMRTTSSTFSFYASEKIFMIIQTKISSHLLEKTANNIMGEINTILKDFQANQMPTEEQLSKIIKKLEKNFYLMA